MYGNARSVVNKIDELRALVVDAQPDIVCITESWSNESHTNVFFKLDGYDLINRRDRSDTDSGAGGGILTYVRSGLKCPESRLPMYDAFNQCCAISVPINGSKSIEIIVVYRPHNLYDETRDVKRNNDLLLDILQNAPKPSVLIGDFNYSDISWDHLSASTPSSKEFLSAVQENFYTQHVDSPTRAQSNTMPDLVLTSRGNLVLGVESIGSLGASDHSMLLVDICGSTTNSKSSEMIPDWAKADIPKLKTILQAVDWKSELAGLPTDAMWTKFKDIIANAQDECIPRKARRANGKPAWLNRTLLQAIRKKRRAWKLFTTTAVYHDYLKYKDLEKSVKKAVLQAKRKFEKKLAANAKKDPKSFYSYLKSKTANKESVGPLKDDDKNLVTDDDKMGELLNTFFSSVFTCEDTENIPSPPKMFSGPSPLIDVDITEEKVSKKINRLRSSAAPGPDGITPRFLQSVSDVISSPLAMIFRQSLTEGCVPDDWRQANVAPVFKKGHRTSVGNYRPISLTSIICKIMESIIRDGIVDHLHDNDVIRSTQHGFMSKRSCLTNLLEYLEDLTKLIDEGNCLDIVYLDFAKAFDKVPHQRLIAKINAAGIGGSVATWISSWLSDRKQRVVLNGTYSSWCPVTSGVPQGSVLGPTLFLIFINDIDCVVDEIASKLSKFADDTKLFRCVNSLSDNAALQRDINALFEWSEVWQMQFNKDKCKVIHIGSKNGLYKYTMGGHAPAGTVLERSVEEKDLGVIVHESLKPSSQCAKAAKKANQVLGQMARAFSYRDKVTFIRLYKQYVRPHLEYAIQAWCPWTDSDIDLLESVQKRVIKMVSGLKSTTYEDRLAEVGLTSLVDRRRRGDMIEVWKILHGKENVEKAKWFTMAADAAQRPTRQSSSPFALKPPEWKGVIRKNFFSNRVVSHWNSLPLSLQSCTNINTFKNTYDSLFSSVTNN